MRRVCINESVILSDFPVELRDEIKSVWAAYLDGRRSTVLLKWDIGMLVKKALLLEETCSGYKGTLTKLQQLFNFKCQRSLLRAVLLCDTFTLGELNTLMTVTPAGFCLCWNHFEYILVYYLTKEQKLYYLNYAKQYGINPNEMYKMIRKAYERTEPGNRQKKAPASCKEFCSRSVKYLESCTKEDSLLMTIPDDVLSLWKNRMPQETYKNITDKLESHIRFCTRLLEKLKK